MHSDQILYKIHQDFSFEDAITRETKTKGSSVEELVFDKWNQDRKDLREELSRFAAEQVFPVSEHVVEELIKLKDEKVSIYLSKKWLRITPKKISDRILAAIHSLSYYLRLQVDFSEVRLSDAPLTDALSKLPHITDLVVNFCPITKIPFPERFRTLRVSHCLNLKDLDLIRVEEMECSCNPELERISCLYATNVIIQQCPKLNEVSLPEMTYGNISYNGSLEALSLPKVRYIEVSWCYKLKQVKLPNAISVKMWMNTSLTDLALKCVRQAFITSCRELQTLSLPKAYFVDCTSNPKLKAAWFPKVIFALVRECPSLPALYMPRATTYGVLFNRNLRVIVAAKQPLSLTGCSPTLSFM